jgi:hypothetical protein
MAHQLTNATKYDLMSGPKKVILIENRNDLFGSTLRKNHRTEHTHLSFNAMEW